MLTFIFAKKWSNKKDLAKINSFYNIKPIFLLLTKVIAVHKRIFRVQVRKFSF